MRWLALFIALFGSAALAQQNSDVSTTTCTFEDGKELGVRYTPESSKKEEMHTNELWPSSSSPMYLFTPTDLTIAGSAIPEGAYSMYVIPEKEKWTLIVDKNVSPGSLYDRKQDLLRTPMQLGQLSEPQRNIDVAFSHIAPRQCNLRIYYGKTGAWVEFKEK
jgi:Protein of unknown function (DUF2911)